MPDLFVPAALSVSQLNALARQLLEENLFGLWVAGEVSNLTRAASGHLYFSLKDAKAQVRCVLFKGVAAQLAVPLKDGDHVELSGKISLYEARGEFQINVSQVRSKGLGALYEAYERLKQRLQAEGLFDPQRKRTLPPYPRTVGIVTSPAAAALRDVVTTLKRRHSGIRVIVYPTPVQGAGSAEQIAQAVRTANRHAQADVLIVCRGGGSIEDLWSYNEEAVVRAVAESALPVVSGVGHETDFTLTDFAADVRAPTPTAAAELVSPDRMQWLYTVGRYGEKLQQSMQAHCDRAGQKLDWLAQRLRHPADKQQARRQRLGELVRQLDDGIRSQHRFAATRLFQAAALLAQHRPDGTARRIMLDKHTQSLQQLWQRRMQAARYALQQQQAVLNAVSPEQILARGYSVVTDTRGRVIRHADTLANRQVVNIRFAEGSVRAQVQKKTEHTAQGSLFDDDALPMA